ncbi:MAG: 4Fe-4S dicluster domain-containing protein [Pseudomonadota bacterium]
MGQEMNRRGFLKGALLAAGAAATSGLVLPQAVQASSNRELATMLDLSKCVGCESCVDACREANAKYMPEPVKPIPEMFPPRVRIEDWSDKREVRDRLTPYNWLYIQTAYGRDASGEEQEVFIPRRCMHCQNPPCANLCPFGAARKEKNGLTRIDADICLGGAKCRQVCPWGIPQRQSGVGIYLDLATSFAGNGVMYKCHRCYERLGAGEQPACIAACPEGVQTIGPRDEIVAQAKKRAEEIKGYLYGLDENGGTNTIYVSPVPFDELDRSLEQQLEAESDKEFAHVAGGQGPKDPGEQRKLRKSLHQQRRQGRPRLGPVADAMADSENLTLALVLAPLAGAAAGLAKAKKFFSREKGAGKS